MVQLVLEDNSCETFNQLLALHKLLIAVAQANSLPTLHIATNLGDGQASLAASLFLADKLHNLRVYKELERLALLVKTLYGNHLTRYAHLRCGNADTLIFGVLHRGQHTAAQQSKILIPRVWCSSL